MLTQDDIKQIEEHFTNVFVRKDDCNDRHEAQDKEMAEIAVQLAKMNTIQNLLVKINAFTATGIGTLLIGAIGKLIIK